MHAGPDPEAAADDRRSEGCGEYPAVSARASGEDCHSGMSHEARWRAAVTNPAQASAPDDPPTARI